MIWTLDDYKPEQLDQYKKDISLLNGNTMINLQIPSNSQRQAHKNLKHIPITFYSKVLIDWSRGWPSNEQQFINFYLNYCECMYTTNRCNGQRFVFGMYEATKTNSSAYQFRSVRENKVKYDMTQYDEIMIYCSMGEIMYFYIYWVSLNKLYILDLHNKAQSLFEHKQLLIQLLQQEYNIIRDFEMKAYYVADIKFNKTINEVRKASLVLDLIQKYLSNKNDAYQVEKIKLNLPEGNLIINRIVWFVYKSFIQNVNINSGFEQINQSYDNQPKLISYEEFHQQPKKVIDYVSKSQLDNQTNSSRTSIFQSAAKYQIINDTVLNFSLQVPKNPINSINPNNPNNPINPPPPTALSIRSIRADEYIEQAKLREVPMMIYAKQQQEILQPPSVNKYELEEGIARAKAEIKAELEEEFKRKQKDWLEVWMDRQKSNKELLQEQIAEEYLNQMKFQKYHGYMQYLLSYYYTSDPQKYQQLLKDYHQGLERNALNGLGEMQKREMLRLITLTKQRANEQQQQLDMVIFNQKKVLGRMGMGKKDFQYRDRVSVLQQEQQEQQESVVQHEEANPFQFRDGDYLGDTDNKVTKYKIKNLYANDDMIEEMERAWDFDLIEQKNIEKEKQRMDKELLTYKDQKYHDDLEGDQDQLINDLNQYRQREQDKIIFKSESQVSRISGISKQASHVSQVSKQVSKAEIIKTDTEIEFDKFFPKQSEQQENSIN